ncbi:MAG: MarR family transcriptional regulator [Modestobacter sp.]|nr:MarR family transcriptional regulator [Modestobacter sp.]MCW2619656.1 MarR family transcriptional regulator [Modestobacter sp.]
MSGSAFSPIAGADRVPAEDPVEQAVLGLEAQMAELWRRGRARTRGLARQVHPQLDPGTYPVLALLVRDGPQRLSALGTVLELDKSTVSRQVDAAVRLGLVERVPDPTDARARLIGLTAEGRTRMGSLHTQQIDRWRGSLATWDVADLEQLTGLLRRLGDTGLA